MSIRQLNLRMCFNAIFADDARLYIGPTFPVGHSEDHYFSVSRDMPLHTEVARLIHGYQDHKGAGVYTSDKDDEMLVMYDRDRVPRGIFPRHAFYNTEFQRYSVWLLVFTRDGKVLLHRRAPDAKDNRGLWDESGGHVDIADSSSAQAPARTVGGALSTKR